MEMNVNEIEPEGAPASNDAVKKMRTRKPGVKRQAKASVPTREPLRLPRPTLLDGSIDSSLQGTLEKKYDEILFLSQDGKKRHALVHSSNKDVKADPLGSSMVNFTLALISATLSGQGQGPDAASIYVEDNWPKVTAYWGKGFGDYKLRIVPAGRSGAATYESTVADFVALAKAKAQIVRNSIKAHGAAKHNLAPKREEKETGPVISF